VEAKIRRHVEFSLTPAKTTCHNLNMETTRQQLEARVRVAFPLPSLDVLVTEAACGLPFHFFGVRGGYGSVRMDLVKAIERYEEKQSTENRLALAKIWNELICDGIEDDFTGDEYETSLDMVDPLAKYVEEHQWLKA
jgi:hypothetical protein